MTGNGSYTYDRISPLQDSKDIVDGNEISCDSATTLNSTDSPRPLSCSPDERCSSNDRASIHSFSTYSSSSSLTTIEKIKNGLGINRLRRKPVWGRDFIKEHPSYETEYARIGKGWWNDQLLVDRSIRSMALLTTCFALAMVTIIVINMKSFYQRPNPHSTSVGGDKQSCKTVQRMNTALLLTINVAATMILGMSNTYQQLVTSLKISDIKWVLQNFGDSRVGTNSPFAINHKRDGKISSWLSWLLLISTSMPVHFLANSLIGPSLILSPPPNIQFNSSTLNSMTGGNINNADVFLRSPSSFPCWSAFRTGASHFPANVNSMAQDRDGIYGLDAYNFGSGYGLLVVYYTAENCARYLNSTTDVAHVETELVVPIDSNFPTFQIEDCVMGDTVWCTLSDSRTSECRLNIRMQAAFLLAGCLVIKALYMITVNLLARGKVKRHCLTFGDVIVASASDLELRVKGECMVNATENVRRHTEHTCHKHCTAEPSATGDEIGHCQKCKKFNTVNKCVGYPQPTVATKFKRPLMANLGNTAMTQMCLLIFCSLAMLFASIFVADIVANQYLGLKSECQYDEAIHNGLCEMAGTKKFALMSGGWGGFNSSIVATGLPVDSLGSEMLSFCISNGAQFIYSLLYLMLVYNVTLICQERDWGNLETGRHRLRCTIVKGESFCQDYLLQLPKRVLFPVMGYSVLTHWMLGEALSTQESIWRDDTYEHGNTIIEHSKYTIVYAAYPLWIATVLILVMTGLCWWAFTYTREGFIPQMFGSIRTCCAATTELDDFPWYGVQWGDLGTGKQFRHAGLSAEAVGKIEPCELYAGRESMDDLQHHLRERRPWIESRESGDDVAG